MCLMLGGGGCEEQMKPQYPVTPACLAHKSKLQLLALIQLGLGLALLFVAPQRAYTVLLTGALLGCITLNLDYCCCIFYMLYAMFDFVAGIDPIGLLV